MAFVEIILLVYVLVSLAGLLIDALPAILLFPIAPFLCAKEIKQERPITAWTIIVLYGLIYAGLFVALLVSILS